jgi:CBS domain-containing protein
MMNVSDVVTRNVISARPSQDIMEVAHLMLEKHISGMPVIDDGGQLVGIVSESDLLRRAETGTMRQGRRWLQSILSPGRLAAEYVHTHGRRVDEVMTRDVVTVTEATPLGTVVELMERQGIKRVPVVRSGQVVGIVSRANLLHALVALSTASRLPAESDARIRQRILAEMQREAWSPRYSINVVVHNGNVDLWGAVFDERERQALRVMVENVSGVKEIHDHMLWVEPLSGTVVPSPEEA